VWPRRVPGQAGRPVRSRFSTLLINNNV
jgi:hypothetical protein